MRIDGRKLREVSHRDHAQTTPRRARPARFATDHFSRSQHRARDHRHFVDHHAIRRIEALAKARVLDRALDRRSDAAFENPQPKETVKSSATHKDRRRSRARQDREALAQLHRIFCDLCRLVERAQKSADQKAFARTRDPSQENIVARFSKLLKSTLLAGSKLWCRLGGHRTDNMPNSCKPRQKSAR